MLCRAAHVSKCVAYRPLRCQRQLYFLRSNSTSPPGDNVNPLPRNWSRETTKTMEKQSHAIQTPYHPSTRTAHIRLWEPPHNIADVWVIKRAMEKKYGSILETCFFKDFEMPDRYQMISFIIFRDLEALERIPEGGEDFTVLAPTMHTKLIHEIGVKDVEAYAGSDEFQPGFQFDKIEGDTTKRVIGGHIRRHPFEYFCNQEHRKLFQKATYPTMNHFLHWGGFNPAKIDTSQPVYESGLFKPDAKQESARMRAALQICSRLTSLPIPQGFSSTDTTPKGQTVPKPGPSLKTARIFAGLYENMPSPALGRFRKEAVDEDDNEETFAPSSSVARELTSETNGVEPADSSPTPSPESPTVPPSIPNPRPVKRPTISPEEKQELERQLHAAKLLLKSAQPVRRRQLKPAVIEPAKRPKPQQWLDQTDTSEVERKKERKGFLAKLASLFGL